MGALQMKLAVPPPRRPFTHSPRPEGEAATIPPSPCSPPPSSVLVGAASLSAGTSTLRLCGHAWEGRRKRILVPFDPDSDPGTSSDSGADSACLERRPKRVRRRRCSLTSGLRQQRRAPRNLGLLHPPSASSSWVGAGVGGGSALGPSFAIRANHSPAAVQAAAMWAQQALPASARARRLRARSCPARPGFSFRRRLDRLDAPRDGHALRLRLRALPRGQRFRPQVARCRPQSGPSDAGRDA